jgi:hypothetical protein
MQTWVRKWVGKVQLWVTLLLFNGKRIGTATRHVHVDASTAVKMVEQISAHSRTVCMGSRSVLERSLNTRICSLNSVIFADIRNSRWVVGHGWILAIAFRIIDYLLHINVFIVVVAPCGIPFGSVLSGLALFEDRLLGWRTWITDATT